MAKSLEIRTELNLDLELTGTYKPKTADYFDRGFGNWLPGEPEGVEDLQVFIKINGVNTDITELISDSDYEALQNDFCSHFRDEQN